MRPAAQHESTPGRSARALEGPRARGGPGAEKDKSHAHSSKQTGEDSERERRGKGPLTVIVE